MHLVRDPASNYIAAKSRFHRAIDTVSESITQSNSELVVTPALKEIWEVIGDKVDDYLRHVLIQILGSALVDIMFDWFAKCNARKSFQPVQRTFRTSESLWM